MTLIVSCVQNGQGQTSYCLPNSMIFNLVGITQRGSECKDSQRLVGDSSTSEREQVALKYLFLIPNPSIMVEELDDLEKQVTKIASIAQKLPEKFQEKGFEILLNALLYGRTPQQVATGGEGKPAALPAAAGKFTIPIDVRAFLQQFNVPEEALSKLFFIHGSEIRPTYKISTTKKAEAQTQIAVLTALESAS